jgi:von Willebrand factor type A domain
MGTRTSARFVGVISCTWALVAVGCGSESKFPAVTPDAAPYNSGAVAGGDLIHMIGPQGTNSACVTSAVNAALANANLIVLFDKSGSMGDPAEGFDPALKWTPVTAAMKAFFSDPKSLGLSASLEFFPQGTDLASVCGYPYYAKPIVPLTPLSSSMALVSAIDATQPAGGTPTLPALQGAITYAQQTAGAHPVDKTLIVLVTDGDPGFGINGQFETGCPNNDIAHVAALAQAALSGTPPISTYVIGVGSDFTNLDAIASGGGTTKAIIAPVNNPTQTGPTFQAALNAIRMASVPCQVSIPSPPDGQKINPSAVNVVLVSGGGGQTVLPYSADCSVASGWHYDDAANPKIVVLCAAACMQAQGDPSGNVTIAFGCQTDIGPTQ